MQDKSERTTNQFGRRQCLVTGLYSWFSAHYEELFTQWTRGEWVRERDANRWKENRRKKGWDRESSVHPITVSGLISSNQIAQLNISKADSPWSWSSHISNQSLCLSLSLSGSSLFPLCSYFPLQLPLTYQTFPSLRARTITILFFSFVPH